MAIFAAYVVQPERGTMAAAADPVRSDPTKPTAFRPTT